MAFRHGGGELAHFKRFSVGVEKVLFRLSRTLEKKKKRRVSLSKIQYNFLSFCSIGKNKSLFYIMEKCFSENLYLTDWWNHDVRKIANSLLKFFSIMEKMYFRKFVLNWLARPWRKKNSKFSVISNIFWFYSEITILIVLHVRDTLG